MSADFRTEHFKGWQHDGYVHVVNVSEDGTEWGPMNLTAGEVAELASMFEPYDDEDELSAAGNYFAVHGNDMIPVKLIDLATVVARMRQVWDELDLPFGVTCERLFTCDLPRLEGYLPEQALREMAEEGERQ